jgi:hypothetical protein
MLPRLAIADAENLEGSVLTRQFAVEFSLIAPLGKHGNVDRTLGNKSELPLRQGSSWLANSITSFGNIPFSSLNLRLEFFLQLETIFEEILQPVTKLFLFL